MINQIYVIFVKTTLYELGTKEGKLEHLYARNEFTVADNKLDIKQVHENKISLRSASMKLSGSQQGFVSCGCKKFFTSRKCKCKSSGLIFSIHLLHSDRNPYNEVWT